MRTIDTTTAPITPLAQWVRACGLSVLDLRPGQIIDVDDLETGALFDLVGGGTRVVHLTSEMRPSGWGL